MTALRLTAVAAAGALACMAVQAQTGAPTAAATDTATATADTPISPAPQPAAAPTQAPEAAPAMPPGPAPVGDEVPDDGRRIPWLENTRHYTWRAAYWLASSVDGWFGKEPFEPRGKVSGYVRISPLWEQHDGLDATLRFRLRADLPNLQGKAYAFLGQDNRNEVVADVPDGFTREQLLLREDRRQDQSFFAGMGYSASDRLDFRLGFRGGIKPYAQARYSTQWLLSPRDVIRFRESLFWSSSDSLGATTLLEYEHAYSRSLRLRWSTTGTVTRRSDGLEWYSALGLFKDLPHLRSASLEMLVQGRTSAVDVSNYGLRASWRQPLYRDWLFGKVTLGHFWPREQREDARVRSWAVGASVEMHF